MSGCKRQFDSGRGRSQNLCCEEKKLIVGKRQVKQFSQNPYHTSIWQIMSSINVCMYACVLKEWKCGGGGGSAGICSYHGTAIKLHKQ